MKKLKLALESLDVASFEVVSPERRERGTVLGNESEPLFSQRFCPQSTQCDVTMAVTCSPAFCP
jgi:hypothetical protein